MKPCSPSTRWFLSLLDVKLGFFFVLELLHTLVGSIMASILAYIGRILKISSTSGMLWVIGPFILWRPLGLTIEVDSAVSGTDCKPNGWSTFWFQVRVLLCWFFASPHLSFLLEETVVSCLFFLSWAFPIFQWSTRGFEVCCCACCEICWRAIKLFA